MQSATSIPIPAALADDLTAHEWSELVSTAGPFASGPGAVLVRQGARPDGVMLLIDGLVEVAHESLGQRRVLCQLGAGELVGEMSLITGEPASATVTAVGSVRGVFLSRLSIQTTAAKQPLLAQRLYQALARVLARRLRGERVPLPEVDRSRLRADAEAMMKTVASVRFVPEVDDVVRRYEALGPRPRFLWMWAARGIEALTLSSVPTSERQTLRDTKLLTAVLNSLLDDIADRDDDWKNLEHALSVLDGAAPSNPWEQLVADLSASVEARVHDLAGWPGLVHLWRFDWHQVRNAMRWSSVLRSRPGLLNRTEVGLYAPSGMNVKIFGTLDLMASPRIDDEELGAVREAIVHAEACASLANAVTTWRRELPEGDISSAVVSEARSAGGIRAADLASADADRVVLEVERDGAEARVLETWRSHRQRVESLAPRCRSVDLFALARACDTILGMYLASAGRL